MNAAVYYFSGTGNSFAVARDIADRINAEMISIAAIVHSEKVKIPAEITGIVFPDYHSGLPNIVKRFISRIDTFYEKYIFGVCTYGGKGPGLTIRCLEQAIEAEGVKLSAEFSVRMPYNYIIPSISLKKFAVRMSLKDTPVEKQNEMFSDWNKKLEAITGFISSRKKGVYETSAGFLLNLIGFMRLKESFGKYLWLKMTGYNGHTLLSFSESRQLMDHGFYSNEKCIGCRTCEKICPVKNIKILKKRPAWQHTCEQCFACLQWCPQSAIQFGKNTENNKRYHHPAVKSSDLMV